MITGFVGQERFHSIDKWGFILFSKNLTDDLKFFVGRKRYEKHFTPLSPHCYFGLKNESQKEEKPAGQATKKTTPPPPTVICYPLSW